MSTQQECAVWYLRWNRPDYECEDTEPEAARLAVAIEESDLGGDILGVQFADGRTIAADQWQDLAEARRWTREREQQRRDNPPPPIPTRSALDPFTGKPVQIETAEPAWLGQPTTTEEPPA